MVDVACIIVPFLFSFYKKHAFYKEWKHFIPANLLVAAFFLVWDYWFTEIGVWGFNPDYLCGIYLGNLPLEEVLFFICIPYACTFTYFALKYLVPLRYYACNSGLVISLLLVPLIFSLFLGYGKMYTFSTSLLLSGVFLVAIYRQTNLNLILLSYLVVLPFFLLSNGLLTGSFIDEPIVWYDNNENLGVRVFTIPVEDFFYGLLLVIGNVTLFEWLKRSRVNS